MARGWESKSVDEQQSADNGKEQATANQRLTPEVLERIRTRTDLELQRERILSQRTSNKTRRAALEAALAEIEARIAKLTD